MNHFHPPRMRKDHARCGIALILAIIILVALMLMGLPFLFSQSAGLGGARAFRDGQQAVVAAQNAERATLAVVVQAMGTHTRPTPLLATATSAEQDFIRYTRLDSATLDVIFGTDSTPPSPFSASIGNSFAIDWSRWKPDVFPPSIQGQPSRSIGVTVEDESGKLDPNSMSIAAWDGLLKAVGIPDWDDNDAYVHSKIVVSATNPPIFSENDDQDHFGELARALAWYAQQLPGRRLATLEQLLNADTGHGETGVPLGAERGNLAQIYSYPNTFGLRRRLTLAELDRLRPYLTIHQPPVGRAGRIDLGTVVMGEMSQGSSPVGITIFDSQGLPIGIGSKIEALDSAGVPSVGMADVLQANAGISNLALTFNPIGTTTSQTFALPNSSLSLIAPMPVNANAMSSIVQQVLHVSGNVPVKTRDQVGLGSWTATVDAKTPALTQVSLTGCALTNPLTLTAGFWNPSTSTTSEFPVEMPPLTLASSGVMTIRSAAAITDILGHTTAQRSQTVVVQAVDQNQPVERRWTTQGEMQELIDQRWGSNVTSWPNPVKRITQDVAQIGSFPDETATTAKTGIRAAVRPPPPANGTSTWRLTDWSEPSGGTILPNIVAGPSKIALDSTQTTGKDALLTPDGLHLLNPVAFNGQSAFGNGNEIGPRRLSFWISTDVGGWTGRVPLFDMRTPSANCGIPAVDAGASAIPADPALQNRVALWYDRTAGVLVLIVAPPTIEQPADLGPLIPLDDPDTADLDERCLGFSDTTELLPTTWLNSALTKARPLAPASPNWYSLINSNHIVHLWSLGSPGGDFFARGHWHRIEVILPSPTPSGLGLIVDGIAGHDVMQSAKPTMNLVPFGAHCTLPALPLKNDIAPVPAADFLASNSTQGDLLTDGTVTAMSLTLPNGNTLHAKDIFPPRGTIRIDDECIFYEEFDTAGDVFKGCVRGQRQDTNVADPTNATTWPVVDMRHVANTLILPLGYRFRVASTDLFRGGCTLADDFSNGEPSGSNSNTDILRLHCAMPPPAQGQTPTWDVSSGVISVDPSFAGMLARFPKKGVLLLSYPNNTQPGYFCYADIDLTGFMFTGVEVLNPAGATPAVIEIKEKGNFLPNPVITSYLYNAITIPQIYLVSMRTAGANPLEFGRYPYPNSVTPAYLQLLNQKSGRVEWIAYDAIARVLINGAEERFFLTADKGWFISRNGGNLNGNRGCMRTDCFGRKFISEGASLFVSRLEDVPFPAGNSPATTTQIIPVQTKLGLAGHLMGTGDVVTILPSSSISTAIPPEQVVVRYAATDGYANPRTKTYLSNNDVVNNYVAFDRLLPDSHFAAGVTEYEIICGTGWSLTTDPSPQPILTPPHYTKATSQLPSAPPRLDRMTPANLWFASTDPNWRLGAGGTLSLAPGAIIDQLNAGMVDSTTVNAKVFDWIDPATMLPIPAPPSTTPPTPSTPRITDQITALPIIVQSDQLFFSSLPQMGLVTIGGEVFAYQKISANTAKLVGRSLLGSRSLFHDSGEPMMYLPIGPVSTIGGSGGTDAASSDAASTNGTLTDSAWMKFDNGTASSVFDDPATVVVPNSSLPPPPTPTAGVTCDAPYLLISKPDGSRVEVTTFFGPVLGRLNKHWNNLDHPYGTEYVTALWTRGLFNSKRVDWVTNPGDLKPIVIGWWPRYAPALSNSVLSGSFAESAMRSRVYSWIGYPHGLFDACFNQTELRKFDSTLNVAQIDGVMEGCGTDPLGQAPPIELHARAAASGQNWTAAGVHDSTLVEGGAATLAEDVFAKNAAFTGTTGGMINTPGGAELRLYWQYNSTRTPVDPGTPPDGPLKQLRDIAICGNATPPSIGAVRLRCLAPLKILASETKR